MIIDVPYEYLAEIRRHLKRKCTVEPFLGVIAVNLPDIDVADMPVAVIYKNFDTIVGPDPKSEEKVLRWYAGSLWEVDPQITSLTAKTPHQHPLGVCIDANRPNTSAKPIEEDRDIDEVRSNNSNEIAAKVKDLCANYAILEGKLWRKTVEPVLVMEPRYSHIEFHVRGPYALDDADTVYRLDSVEEAVADHTMPDAHQAPMAPMVRIEIPSALNYPADEKSALACAKDLIKWMREKIGDDGAAFFARYEALRDAFKAFSVQDTESVETLKDALAEAAEASAGRTKRDEYDLFAHPPAALMAKIERAIRRVDRRLVDAHAMLSM